MAVPNEAKYSLVPIEPNWRDFRIEYNGKDVSIYGKDGIARDWFSGQLEEIILYHFEQHWSGLSTYEIFDFAYNDEGHKFLILKRLKIKDE